MTKLFNLACVQICQRNLNNLAYALRPKLKNEGNSIQKYSRHPIYFLTNGPQHFQFSSIAGIRITSSFYQFRSIKCNILSLKFTPCSVESLNQYQAKSAAFNVTLFSSLILFTELVAVRFPTTSSEVWEKRWPSSSVQMVMLQGEDSGLNTAWLTVNTPSIVFSREIGRFSIVIYRWMLSFIFQYCRCWCRMHVLRKWWWCHKQISLLFVIRNRSV